MRRSAQPYTLFIILGIWLWPLAGAAQLERYALIVEGDRGEPAEVADAHAEGAAAQLFEVLLDIGDFEPSNILLLRAADAEAVTHALLTLDQHIQSSLLHSEHKALLFVYAVGRVDADMLQLGGTRLPLAQLAQLTRDSVADARLLIVDSCGADSTLQPLAAGYVPASDLAFLSAHGSCQEAGSSFTQAMAAAVRGAADRDGNGVVTLDEAYHFATRGLTARARRSAFTRDFRGLGPLSLTRPAVHALARSTLRFPPGASYELRHDHKHGELVAQLGESQERQILSVRPGRYFVQATATQATYEGAIDAHLGRIQPLDLSRLNSITYARLVRSGQSGLPLAQAFELGMRLRTPLPNAETPCLGASLGYAIDLPSVGARVRLSACGAGFDNAVVIANTDAYDLDVHVYHAWDFALVTLELGVTGGLSLFTQEFVARSYAPSRRTLAPFAALGGSLQFDLGSAGIYMNIDTALEAHVLRQREDAFSEPHRVVGVALRSSLSLGKHF
jgi:hypothetical protein